MIDEQEKTKTSENIIIIHRIDLFCFLNRNLNSRFIFISHVFAQRFLSGNYSQFLNEKKNRV